MKFKKEERFWKSKLEKEICIYLEADEELGLGIDIEFKKFDINTGKENEPKKYKTSLYIRKYKNIEKELDTIKNFDCRVYRVIVSCKEARLYDCTCLDPDIGLDIKKIAEELRDKQYFFEYEDFRNLNRNYQ